MGARQSRRSVDITTTPKKEGLPADGGVGDAAAPGDGKLERIEEADTKPTTNGIAPHTDVPEDKDKDKDDATEKEKDKEQQEEVKETKQESGGESPAETAEVTTPTEASTPNTATSPDNKETKKKEKMKKKWSFRSISFSKKDKNKPAREEAPKNGDVTKEEPLAEGGEEQENGSGSPVEEKSAVSSPTTENEEAAAVAAASSPASSPQPASSVAEAKEESSGAASAASSPAEEKTEESADPTPAPVEEKKEEVEKLLEAEKKAVEVSPAVGGQSDPVLEASVFRAQTVATPSIIERKTSEDIPSLPPSSPPPTPIDSSPLQQAQQAAATATALAEALKLPAEAARCSQHFAPPTASSTDLAPPTAANLAPLPVVVDRDDDSHVNSQSSCALVVREAIEPHHPLPTLPQHAVEDERPQACNDHDNNDRPLPVGDEMRRVHETMGSSSTITTTTLTTTSRLDPEDGGRSMDNNAIVSEIISEIVEESVARRESASASASSRPANTREEEIRESIEEMIAPNEAAREEERATVVDPPVATIDAIVESEEGPVPVSCEPRQEEEEEEQEEEKEEVEEMLVEAKPALVIPEDEEVNSCGVEPVQAIAEATDKLETETVHSTDMAVAVEEILISEMADGRQRSKQQEGEEEVAEEEEEEEDCCSLFPDQQEPVIVDRSCSSSNLRSQDSSAILEEEEEEKEEEEASNLLRSSSVLPPPSEPSSLPLESFPAGGVVCVAPREKFDPELMIEASNPPPPSPPRISAEEERRPIENPNESEPVADVVAVPPLPSPPPPTTTTTTTTTTTSDDETSNRRTMLVDQLERVPSLADDLFPSQHAIQRQQVDSFDYYPLPPEQLSSPPSSTLLAAPETRNEEHTRVPTAERISTETTTPLPPPSTLPGSPPSPPTSNASITSGLTPFTVDSSQSLLYDDQSNREFKMESVSISLNSYNESDIELKERLAESLAETEKQEESLVSCQLLNNATSSTTVQETHQSTPEQPATTITTTTTTTTTTTEAPVENNVGHDASTTESTAEPVKVTSSSPAVPSEVITASPPSAPAITEDVASVAKAIEEIDISDKAVAAATIECNTNEIIAEARYQNNINE